ncbi:MULTISPECIES: GntR family transcriptional regulator [Paenibacillus]|uniref:GntR family transcriptional regulator n=1 Tax=Paenibacillus oceani TaxID=2772510 RepID=A0A927H2L7_9BACL|nr:GntR family transcriptional regulator [Paenibacillus oceani]MBD2866386.1 GntR family transcriptional regulator [Paenibacillus oceani]
MSRLIGEDGYADGKKLPSEKELAETYGVSRETIRKALKHLTQLGRVYSIRGSGHYVRHWVPQMESTLNRLTSITELIKQSQLVEGEMEVHFFKRVPTKDEAELLQIHPLDPVFVVDRIRTAGGEPLIFNQNVLPQSVVGEDFPLRYEKGSLLNCLRTRYRIDIAEAMTEVLAVRAEDLLPYRLKETGAPLLKFKQVHYDAKALPIFLSYDIMRNDVIRFFIRRVM